MNREFKRYFPLVASILLPYGIIIVLNTLIEIELVVLIQILIKLKFFLRRGLGRREQRRRAWLLSSTPSLSGRSTTGRKYVMINALPSPVERKKQKHEEHSAEGAIVVPRYLEIRRSVLPCHCGAPSIFEGGVTKRHNSEPANLYGTNRTVLPASDFNWFMRHDCHMGG